MEPVQVVFCYAREDEPLRDDLERHLGALKRAGQAITWHDRKILPGTDWAKEIDLHVSTADVILLLVSSYFIHSDYCYSVEMRKALEMHEAGKAHVIPIVLRPVDWKETPLRKLQALPRDGKPIVTWHIRDAGLLDVVHGIRQVIIPVWTQRLQEVKQYEEATTAAISTLQPDLPDAVEQLEATVGKLQEGNLTLEQALLYFEQGMELAKYCNDLLQESELRVQHLLEHDSGS